VLASWGDWALVAAMGGIAVALAVYAGAELKTAAGAAAAALAGAALTRSVDIVRERQSAASRSRVQELGSLSETRRLMMSLRATMEHDRDAYMSATVVNSLLHNHPTLLEPDDVDALARWRDADFLATESAHDARLAFDRIEPKIGARELDIKS
jgi:hypothetical protein